MARPAVKKQDIEDAAIRLFASKGLASTTIKDIAQEAGVTDGALYRHFKSKNDMAFFLFRRELENFGAQLRQRLFQDNTPFTLRLENAIRFIFDFYRKHTVTFTFIMLTQHGFPDEDKIDPNLNPNDLSVRFIAQGMRDGDIPAADAPLIAGLAFGLVMQPLIMDRYHRLTLAPDTVEHVLNAAKRVLQTR